MKEEVRTEDMLFMMKKIGLYLTTQMELNLRDRDISGVQVYFMVYILRHHPKGTYLTELCREIGVSKPTLSALIKKLRGKGYLFFQENPEDIRKKKVLPTVKLFEEGKEFLKKAGRMEEEICSTLNVQEKIQLWELEQKILRHLSEMGCKENRQEVLLT
ncbi:MAG TPA: MarR family transcriptional regulator [Candidatus Choladousia intestinavium]|uniref:MarR family transcriptional regulator n=1 Tax=Candidatus Choladousia intestinavium TaxID=2840727 RepID=A0A9D1ADD0_9FIRM|nr:MarR family transcriptional regulator [Candidatus Choladousia intestinavium]